MNFFRYFKREKKTLKQRCLFKTLTIKKNDSVSKRSVMNEVIMKTAYPVSKFLLMRLRVVTRTLDRPWLVEDICWDRGYSVFNSQNIGGQRCILVRDCFYTVSTMRVAKHFFCCFFSPLSIPSSSSVRQVEWPCVSFTDNYMDLFHREALIRMLEILIASIISLFPPLIPLPISPSI